MKDAQLVRLENFIHIKHRSPCPGFNYFPRIIMILYLSKLTDGGALIYGISA